MPRIFLAESLVSHATVVLPAPAVRHVQALRLQRGDQLELFNGNDDADWPGEIVEVGRHRVVVRIGAPIAVERELGGNVTLALGVPANDRMDALVEKAGELGAAAIQPLVCARSVLRLAGERAEVRRRHWQAVAASASEQCGRA
ncbi:MAG TPA: RsmE family RNA methyltransferase, partial [Caldimonas sp.]